MNGFSKHGITHLSASSINLWTNAPDMWVAKYLHGFKSEFGPAPRRGQCVETAVHMALTGTPVDQAVTRAQETFDHTFKFGDEDISKERDLIEPMTAIALEELKPLGVPAQGGDEQAKITIHANFDGWSIPVIGFLDLTYPDQGLIVDLKTTNRIPSTMSADHQLQRAIYSAATGNQTVKFLYVSAKKASWLEDGDPAEILARAKVQIARMERFLNLHSAEDALACVPVNPFSFYWRGDEDARREMFGI
jgi:hypothetical protein